MTYNPNLTGTPKFVATAEISSTVDVDVISGTFGTDVTLAPGPGTSYNGQYFTTNSSGDLQSIRIYLENNSGSTGTMKLDVYTMSFTSGNQFTLDSLLGSSDTLDVSTITPGLYTFNFSSTVTLSAATIYAFVIDVDGATNTLVTRRVTDVDPNIYAGGNGWLSNSARTTFFYYTSGSDLQFDVSLQTAVTGANFKLQAATSGDIDIKLPNTVTSYDLIMPDAQSSTGKVLRNDGLGSLTWSNPWSVAVVAGATTAKNGDLLFTNTTSAPFTVTLPASPSTGDVVKVVDHAGTWNSNNLTVARNGRNINGLASDTVLNTSNGWAEFVYTGDLAIGWKILQ